MKQIEHSMVSPTIVPRNRVVNFSAEAVFSDILPCLSPDSEIGHGIAYSDAYELRVRTLRRGQCCVGEFRLRPLPSRKFVECQRRIASAAAHRTNDLLCNCPAGTYRPSVPCAHRAALLSIGGTDAFYRWLAESLANPHLLTCPECNGLLDGTQEEVTAGKCLPCRMRPAA